MSIQYFDTTDLKDKPIFSKEINVRVRNKNSKYYSLDGFITYVGVKKRVHRVTDKLVNKSNKLWLERNLHQTLWELSDFYKDIQKEKLIQQMDTTPTVEEFGLKSLRIGKPKRKSSTNKKYSSIFKTHILPNFGSRKMNSFKPSDLNEFQSNLLESGKSPKTVIGILSVINTFFDECVNDEIIQSNPLNKVTNPTLRKSDINPFTIDEVTKILKKIDDKYKPMFVLSFFSGMRWGEIIGLQWKDIDFENNEISINQSIVDTEMTTPKTENSKNIIDMLPIVKEYLLIQKERNLHSEWVFVTQYGNHYTTTDNINSKILKPLLKKLNIKERPLRQSRHTFSSMMLSQNEDILWVSHMLRHSNITTTLNIYSKYVKQKKIKRGEFSNSLEI